MGRQILLLFNFRLLESNCNEVFMEKSSYLRYGIYAFFMGIGAGDLLNCKLVNVFLIVGLSVAVFLIIRWGFGKVFVRLFLVLLCCFGLGSGRFFWAEPQFTVNNVGFYRDIDNGIVLEGVLASEPEFRNNAQYLLLEARKLVLPFKEMDVGGRVLIKTKPFPRFFYDERLLIKGNLLTPAEFEKFSYKEYLAKDNIFSVMYNPYISVINDSGGRDFFGLIYYLKDQIKNRAEAFVKEPGASIVIGLLIGARASIPQNILDDFQRTGLTHILAISGYNITLIINIFALIMSKSGRRSRFWITTFMIGVFAVLTGLSASVVRASIMGILVILATYMGRKGGGLQLLLLSGMLMVMSNPMILLRDISFQLSFLSTAGLLILLPLIEKYFKNLPPFIAESLSVTLTATVFTTPIILLNFGKFSIVSPFANVLFLPLIPMIMLVSFMVIVASLIFTPLAQLFAAVCFLLTTILLDGVSYTAKIPFAMLESGGFNLVMFFMYYFLLFLLIRFFRKSRSARAC